MSIYETEMITEINRCIDLKEKWYLKRIKYLEKQNVKLKCYRDRAHKALCEISHLSENEMNAGKAWDIAHDAILCLNEIRGV